MTYTQNKDNFSEVVEIMLFKYNMLDAKLWALIKREPISRKVNESSLVIGKQSLRKIIETNFKSEINKFRSVENAMVYKDATSIYFIWKMLEEMEGLLWIKINLSLNAKYSRIVSIDHINTIKFSIKIIRGTFRTFDYFKSTELPLVNTILEKAGILKSKTPYDKVSLAAMLSALDLFLTTYNTVEMASVVERIIDVLERYENDNPEVLIVTDYDSDI